MAKQDLLTVLDQAIAALQAARKAHVDSASNKSGGSPKVLSTTKQASKPTFAKRGMSEEGRQRIAEAQRKRWAAKKRADKKAARLAAASS